MSGKIKALVVDDFGDWQRTRLGEVELGEPGDDEVLIENRAMSINFPDILMIEGKYQVRPSLPFVPGRDAAGTVLSVGRSVRDIGVGDRVAAQPGFGAFAARTLSPARYCTKIPAGMSFDKAAACNTTLATVVAAVSVRIDLRPGEWILITGAAGGVGSAGVQYARAIGGKVVALVSSKAKEDAVRQAGADIVLRTDLIEDLKEGIRKALNRHGLESVDAAMDVVGGAAFDGLLRCVRPEGRIAIVGFASTEIPLIPANYLLLKDLRIFGSSINRQFSSPNAGFRRLLANAFDMVADGRIDVMIEAKYSLAEFATAMKRIAARQVIGKVLLEP